LNELRQVELHGFEFIPASDSIPNELTRRRVRQGCDSDLE
jgi:hypothetical protein